MDRREVEYLRRLLATPPPGRPDALDRERALRLLDDLCHAQDEMERLRAG